MKVMVLVKASPSSEAGTLPSEELMHEMGQFNEELVKAGIMKAGEGLKPSSAGKRIHFSGKDRTVIDGPFAETKELVAGFWLWEVNSLEEAIAWVKRCPNPMLEDSDIEIRPLYQMSDFAEMDPSGEVAMHEEKLMNTMATQTCAITPYLFFSGQCEEALEFYQHALGAKLGMLMRFSESPDPPPEGMLQAGFENKIMHADFTVGGTMIMASDGCDDKSKFAGFRLAIQLPHEADVHRAFNALAEGGNVDMPLGQTFWSPCFGMVTDKFNVAWMVMLGQQ
jgi:PhnB protein